MTKKPRMSSDAAKGDFGKFTQFMRRLIAVPHSEIKDKLEAEKRAKKQKRASRA